QENRGGRRGRRGLLTGNTLIPNYEPSQRRHTVGGGTNIYLGHKTRRSLVSPSNLFRKFSDAISLHKVDRTSAKSTAGHSRAVDSFHLRREIDHRVQLRAAHFVVLFQAAM